MADVRRFRGPIDLHTHSSVSDGTETPAELVRSAAAAGLGIAWLPEEAKGPAFATATGLLVYPQAAHLEHFESNGRRTGNMTTDGYIARVGRWLRESF